MHAPDLVEFRTLSKPERNKPCFAGAIAKVDNANNHIRRFAAEEARWFAKHPYHTVQTTHERTGDPGYYLYCRFPLPDRKLALYIGDALHNLRTALDHLACSCAIANGNDTEHVAFTILRKEDGLEAALKSDLRKAGPLAIDLVRKLAPTPHGNPMLAGLHLLDIEDKHRLILPITHSMQVEVAVGAFEQRAIVRTHGASNPPEVTSCFIPAPEGYEEALAHEFNYSGEIMFPPGTPFANQPCLEILNELSWVVADVIKEFELAFGSVCLSYSISRERRAKIK